MNNCPPKQRRSTSPLLEFDNDYSRVIRVQGTLFKVDASVLSNGSPVFKEMLSNPDGSGGQEDPLVLSGLWEGQFRSFLWAVHSKSPLDALAMPLPRLCSIAEVAYVYSFKNLQVWAIDGLSAVINSPNTVLRSASSAMFARVLRLAILYDQRALSISIQSKWMSRIHWHELPPTPAILFADEFDLRYLLSHAFYVHLVNMAPRISNSERIDMDSPLDASQNLHLYCGYYSLSAYWKHLQHNPITFDASAECRSHEQCLMAWAARWAVAVTQPSHLPTVDVFNQLVSVEIRLRSDEILDVCMSRSCKVAALYSVRMKRAEISARLHHHFDL